VEHLLKTAIFCSFLWFWFIALATLTGLGLLYRIAIVLLPTLRFYIINRKAHFNSHQEVTSITNRCQIGNWFVLSLLAKNLNSNVFGELITDLAGNLNERMDTVTYGFDSNRKD
jgi:innexin